MMKMNNTENRLRGRFEDGGTLAVITYDGPELYNLIRKYPSKSGRGLSFNTAHISYFTGKGEPAEKKGVILYDIPKVAALNFAKKLGLESIIFKDTDFIGIVNANGSVSKELETVNGKYNCLYLEFALMIEVVYPVGMVKSPNKKIPETEQVVLFNKQTD